MNREKQGEAIQKEIRKAWEKALREERGLRYKTREGKKKSGIRPTAPSEGGKSAEGIQVETLMGSVEEELLRSTRKAQGKKTTDPPSNRRGTRQKEMPLLNRIWEEEIRTTPAGFKASNLKKKTKGIIYSIEGEVAFLEKGVGMPRRAGKSGGDVFQIFRRW